MADETPQPAPDAKVIPIVEKREAERRTKWHTPEDCFKLLGVQKTVDEINAKLLDGNDRFINIEANQAKSLADRLRLERKLDDNCTKTDEVWEIMQMFKGLGRGIAAIGRWMKKGLTAISWIAGLLAPIAVLYFTLKDNIFGK